MHAKRYTTDIIIIIICETSRDMRYNLKGSDLMLCSLDTAWFQVDSKMYHSKIFFSQHKSILFSHYGRLSPGFHYLGFHSPSILSLYINYRPCFLITLLLCGVVTLLPALLEKW